MHAEAFWADGTLVNPRPSYVSYKLPQLVFMGTVNKNVRFDVVNRRTDFFRWQTNKTLHDALHVLVTAVLEADFVLLLIA